MNTLVPEFAVSDCRRSLEFYCEILGFSIGYERPEEGFAFLELGAAELMIDQIGTGITYGGAFKPDGYPFGRGLNLQIEVPAIAPLLDALAASKIDLFIQPEDRWYRKDTIEVGQRQFVVADPDGYLLRFCESLGQRTVCAPLETVSSVVSSSKAYG